MKILSKIKIALRQRILRAALGGLMSTIDIVKDGKASKHEKKSGVCKGDFKDLFGTEFWIN